MHYLPATLLQRLAEGSHEAHAERVRAAVAAVRETESLFKGATKVEVRLTFSDHAIVVTDGPTPLARVGLFAGSSGLNVVKVEAIETPSVTEENLDLTLSEVTLAQVDRMLRGEGLDPNAAALIREHAHILAPDQDPEGVLVRLDEALEPEGAWRKTLAENAQGMERALTGCTLTSANHPARFGRLYNGVVPLAEARGYEPVLVREAQAILSLLEQYETRTTKARGCFEAEHPLAATEAGRATAQKLRTLAEGLGRSLKLVREAAAPALKLPVIADRARAFDLIAAALPGYDRGSLYLSRLADLARSTSR